MAEGSFEQKEESVSPRVTVGHNLDLKGEKPWALRALYSLLGWQSEMNSNGLFDVKVERKIHQANEKRLKKVG